MYYTYKHTHTHTHTGELMCSTFTLKADKKTGQISKVIRSSVIISEDEYDRIRVSDPHSCEVHTHTHTHTNTHTSICVCVCVCVCLYIYTDACVYICIATGCYGCGEQVWERANVQRAS